MQQKCTHSRFCEKVAQSYLQSLTMFNTKHHLIIKMFSVPETSFRIINAHRRGNSVGSPRLSNMQHITLYQLQQHHPYQTLLCRFEGLGREAVQAEQPGFVIGGTGTETIYQQTKWRTRLFSIWLSFAIVRFA